MKKQKGGHKPNKAQVRKREIFRLRHPEGRKVYSHKRRGHDCKWTESLKK